MMVLPRFLAVLFTIILVSACQTGAPSDNISFRSKTAPVKLVSAIAINAQECWFKSGDRAFRSLRMSSEVNSFSGRPRLLLVTRSDPTGLPRLVVQAETKGDTASGTYTNVQAFGPLLQSGAGTRIASDVRRWSNGSKDCA